MRPLEQTCSIVLVWNSFFFFSLLPMLCLFLCSLSHPFHFPKNLPLISWISFARLSRVSWFRAWMYSVSRHNFWFGTLETLTHHTYIYASTWRVPLLSLQKMKCTRCNVSNFYGKTGRASRRMGTVKSHPKTAFCKRCFPRAFINVQLCKTTKLAIMIWISNRD